MTHLYHEYRRHRPPACSIIASIPSSRDDWKCPTDHGSIFLRLPMHRYENSVSPRAGYPRAIAGPSQHDLRSFQLSFSRLAVLLSLLGQGAHSA